MGPKTLLTIIEGFVYGSSWGPLYQGDKGPEVQQDNEEFRRDMSVGLYVLFM